MEFFVVLLFLLAVCQIIFAFIYLSVSVFAYLRLSF